MLNVYDGHRRYGRRDFLKIGSLGLGGLTLADLIAGREATAASGKAVRDKAVVFLFMHGGPSQVETFDPKMTAPSEYRAMFGEVKTSLPGVTFGSHFPMLGKLAHKMAVVRSFRHGNGSHGSASALVAAGGNSTGACMGSLYSRIAGLTNGETGLPNNCLVVPAAAGKPFEDLRAVPERVTSVGNLPKSFAPFDPSKGAGILTAWLIALMPGHISHATFGLADHDSFALLFLSMAFYYWVRALDNLGTERLFQNPNSSPLYLIAGIRETWHRNPRAMAFATLSGISFATVALGWKGFVYGPGILFLAYSGQIILNMFRKRDSLPLTSATLQMLLTSFFIPLPFYMWPGLNLVFDPSGFQPMFYIIGFTLALGWVASSFRDKPWLLVLGTGGVLIGGILALSLIHI